VNTKALAPNDFVPSITSRTSARPISQVPSILKISRIPIPCADRDKNKAKLPFYPADKGVCAMSAGLLTRWEAPQVKTIVIPGS
jgi:hypothetical protein